ncbi:CBS domain-containing protein [Haloarcula sp. CBA1130]|uniref:CBS domain-containing protein n=1 Tax=unclassified Haloarcula TaxID=2624677 RepID=UPI001248C88F|nr:MULTISPECIES: CBS domain-containing protein [unclassified Haloarcula]KAA9399084.1 CBS domain-containing protein [Haloarcula sp. CBA1129]KAA9403598.1 CBS domain-containing protein [Haloarcula sp. CBA1130]
MLVPMLVREIMRTPVRTIGPDAPVVKAAQRLRDEDIGSLVVEDDGGCVGIITESDIVAVTAAEGDTRALTVGDVMAKELVTVSPDADIETAVERLRTNNIKKLPVVEDGTLVGIVTTTNLSDYIPHLTRTRGTADGPPQRKRFTRPDTLYEDESWTFESYGTADGIDVGDHVRFSKTISKADVEAFAEASGDTNRLHLDAAFADGTRFGRRIAHGTLVSGIISAALARLPGLTIYLSQELSYQGPVGIDEEVTARCEVVERIKDNRFRLATAVDDAEGNCVIEGDAVVISDPIPDTA